MNVFVTLVCRNHQDLGLRIYCANLPDSIDAIAIRQFEIEQNQVRTKTFEQINRLPYRSAFAANGIRGPRLENCSETCARDWVIVDDENAGHRVLYELEVAI